MRPFNLAKMRTTTVGAYDGSPLVLSSAVPGFLTFAQAGVTNGMNVSYGIADGINSEVGVGTYTAAGTTLTRNVVRSTAANAQIPLSGVAHVSIVALAEDVNFQSGTLALFQQTSAPTGWVKQTTFTDHMLRCVSGGANSGGNIAFSSCFGRQVADAFTTSLYYWPSHGHPTTWWANPDGASYGPVYGGTDGPVGWAVPMEGSDYGHAHLTEMRVQYVDLIIASKV